MAFKQVSSQVDFPALEKEILEWWYSSGLVQKYLHKNDSSDKKFTFLDGPITANNPMGVHHAWGRTYKDLWQRYFNMKGYAGRFQNGFDCQGLWVEVEVEKELGFKNKKDIETYGVANFINKCKERVQKYSSMQADQSKRLGYFMDWDNSYFTMSDENNYAIWNFLKAVWERGWLYKGHDVVPWCPRCETAISQHEMLTEDYKELTHSSIFLALPITEREKEYLLIWTTTPWTLPANTAVAVDKDLEYVLVENITGFKYWIAKEALKRVMPDAKIKKTVTGQDLVGLHYSSPFDGLPLIAQAISESKNKFHLVIPTDKMLMPISTEEGTGLVHTSTSTGEEDHHLGKKLGLPVIPAIDDQANYLEGFGEFSRQNAKKHPELIIDYLKQFKSGENLFKVLPYTHRYPACWRCKSELVWKIADEWYISMDKKDPTDKKGQTLRKQLISTAKKIKWMPQFGLDRELDWLKNMHDWLISKKNRYWGLALPIYECSSCGHFEVIGSKAELKQRAFSGWEKFSQNSPHKPWVDEVVIKCPKCTHPVRRIPDVGNPWLDAGIVSISTLPESWFPADFITESFPGQFKNWFYSLIVMSTVLKKTSPTKNILGFASMLGEDGRAMHKSWGNSIEFNEGADKIGADVMRWIFSSQNVENNLLFGYKLADETRRRFHLMLWNVYNFFLTYASIDGFTPEIKPASEELSLLDNWLNIRLDQTINAVTDSLDRFDAKSATEVITQYVNDLSLWYVRRSRDRVGPSVPPSPDKYSCHYTLYSNLVTLSQILAPFMPFISESIFKNLTSFESVHLSDWPKKSSISKAQAQTVAYMESIRKVVEQGLSTRKNLQLKVRQPLRKAVIANPNSSPGQNFENLIKAELNVKEIDWQISKESSVSLDSRLDENLIAEGQAREMIRQVQDLRKQMGAKLDQNINLFAPLPQDKSLLEQITSQTLTQKAINSSEIKIELL